MDLAHNLIMSLEELAGYVSVKEAARRLRNRSLKTIYRLIESGRLPAKRIIGRLYVREEDLLGLVEEVEPKRRLGVGRGDADKEQRKDVARWRSEVRRRSRI